MMIKKRALIGLILLLGSGWLFSIRQNYLPTGNILGTGISSLPLSTLNFRALAPGGRGLNSITYNIGENTTPLKWRNGYLKELYLTGTSSSASTATKIVAAYDSQNKEKADYLADGTDDQAEIQTALDSLTTGGTVVLLAGNYEISGSITIPAQAVLLGQGYGTHIRLKDNAPLINPHGILVSNPYGEVRSLRLDGNVAANRGDFPGVERFGIFITGHHAKVIDNFIHDWNVYDIQTQPGADYALIQGNTTWGALQDGIELSGGDFLSVIGNTSHDNGMNGFEIEGSENVTLTGNTAEGNYNAGIELSGTRKATVSNNTIRIALNFNGTVVHGIALDMAVQWNTVEGNIISLEYGELVPGKTYYGIRVEQPTHPQSSNMTIANNSIWNVPIPIYLEAAQGLRVTGNVIANLENFSDRLSHNLYGIYLSHIDDSIITENIIRDSRGDTDIGSGGIILDASSRNIIANNSLTNNSRTANAAYSVILLKNGSTQNTIQANTIKEEAESKANYGIREDSPADNHNNILDNFITGPLSQAISSRGTNTILTGNKTGAPEEGFEITALSPKLRLNQASGSAYLADLTIDPSGDLKINATGKKTVFTGNVTVERLALMGQASRPDTYLYGFAQATNPTKDQYGIYVAMPAIETNTDTARQLTGNEFRSEIWPDNTKNWTNPQALMAFRSYIKLWPPDQIKGAPYTVNGAIGYRSEIIIEANTTMNNFYGFYSLNPNVIGTLNNNYGIYLENQTGGGNDYGIYIAGADTYAIWVDSGKVRLDGDLEIQGKIISNNNSRGINTPVQNGTTQITITFENPRSSADFAVTVTPSWNSAIWVSGKQPTGFTVNFANPPADNNQTLDWIILD